MNKQHVWNLRFIREKLLIHIVFEEGSFTSKSNQFEVKVRELIPRKIQFKGGSSLNIYFHEASFSHTFQNSYSKIGHLSRKGTFYSKKSLHKSCWKCNFEDFLFYDFFSWDTSFSHKWHLKMTNLGHFSEWSFKKWPFVAKGGILERQVLRYNLLEMQF